MEVDPPVRNWAPRMRVTASNRKFALNLTRRAAAMAARSGMVTDNQRIAWRLLVEASHKPRKR